MSAKIRRILFSVAVLVWSAVILYFYATGEIAKYLAPDFRLMALVGGLGLAVLGLFNLLTSDQEADCGHDHDTATDPHDHESGDVHPLVALAVLIIPLALSTAWTTGQFSQKAAASRGLYDTPAQANSPFIASMLGPITREDIEKNHHKTPDGYYEMPLMELFFSSGDPELQKATDGMKIQTEGRWAEEKVGNPNGTRKRLYRMFITCCAADSRAIPIILEFGKTPPEMPENGWVKVSGTMTFPIEGGLVQPVLQVEQALAAEPPYEESFMRR